MEIASIKGDTVLLMYHPAEAAADVGQQFTILEVPERTEGLVAQVTSNDSLEYPGLQQEMIQRVLEERADDRRLRDWQAAGVLNRLHTLLLAELHAAGKSTGHGRGRRFPY